MASIIASLILFVTAVCSGAPSTAHGQTPIITAPPPLTCYIVGTMISRALLPALALCASLAPAADWPQWRGPGRTGISQEKGLLSEWPAGGPKQLWHITGVGDGYGAPAV